MKTFFDRQRLPEDGAQKVAEKMTSLVGETAEASDYKAAMEIVEDETLTPEDWFPRLQEAKQRMTVMPAQSDKQAMIGLDTDDQALRRLFNTAARLVMANKYGGFHQIGPERDDGLSAWEIGGWVKTHPTQILDEVFEQMKQLAKVE